MWPTLHTQQKKHIFSCQKGSIQIYSLSLSLSLSVGGYCHNHTMDLLYNLLWKANRFQNLEYFEVWVPLNHPFYFRIFHEINHPAGLGIPMNMETSIFQKGIQSFPYLNPSNPSFWVKWTIMLLGGFGYGVGQMDLCKHPQKRWQHEKLMILRLFSTNHIQFIYMWIDMIIANNNYLNE